MGKNVFEAIEFVCDTCGRSSGLLRRETDVPRLFSEGWRHERVSGKTTCPECALAAARDSGLLEEERQAFFDGALAELPLSVRTRNALARQDIRTLHELLEVDEDDLLSFPNFGEKCLEEVNEMLSVMGLALASLPRDDTFRARAWWRHAFSTACFSGKSAILARALKLGQSCSGIRRAEYADGPRGYHAWRLDVEKWWEDISHAERLRIYHEHKQ